MISWLAETLGQVVGETVHQTGKAINGTVDLVKEAAEDISNIPEAFAKGYDEELFNSKPDEHENVQESQSQGETNETPTTTNS
jgi:hypothetical protein